jgi:hypothetical protein
VGIAMVEASGHRPDYERTDANPHLVAILAAGVALFLLVSPYALLAIYPLARQEPAIKPAPLPPEPRLQINPHADLRDFRLSEEARLSHYGWVDRDHGVVRLCRSIAR